MSHHQSAVHCDNNYSLRKTKLARQFSVQASSSTCSSATAKSLRHDFHKQTSVQSYLASANCAAGANFDETGLPYHLVDESLPPSPHHLACAVSQMSVDDDSFNSNTTNARQMQLDCEFSLPLLHQKSLGNEAPENLLKTSFLTISGNDDQCLRRESFNYSLNNFASMDTNQSQRGSYQSAVGSVSSLSSSIRRTSRSMDKIIRQNSPDVKPNVTCSLPPTMRQSATVLEVPIDRLSFANSNARGDYEDLTSMAPSGQCRNLRTMSVKRKWSSFRARLGRLGTNMVGSQQCLYSYTNSQHYLATDDSMATSSNKNGTMEVGMNSKQDAKVQFDDNAQENNFAFDQNMEEMMKISRSSKLKEQFFAFFQPSDNRLAMKLFGNQNALMKEKQRQQQHGRWVIHPCSNFRFYWDLLMLVLLISNLIILPVAISFFNDDLSLHWIVFNCISDTVFLCDIAVNFRTGVITNDYADEILLNPRLIARHYIRTWFLLDLMSSIPMDYIFLILNEKNNISQLVHAGRALRILRLAKLLSLLRLLRLSRLVRYVSQWEEFFNAAHMFIRILNLIFIMLLMGHWNGCLQFLVPLLQDFPSDCWVTKLDLETAFWFEQYTWALFKAMSHMLSIGYGRFPPTSTSEAWITIVSMMTGATCYALFVGHAAALIQSFDTSKRLYREKFKQVEEYMAYRKLPRGLRQRIASYYEHRYQGKMFQEPDILNELSECLREQIINYNCRALVAAVPFFTYADQDFVSEVVTKLKYEVFQPGDLIIKEGTIGTKMYFIQEGIVDIITKDGEVATSLSDGSYFGEICLLTNAKRVASVRAETYCNVYSLEREHFLSVLNHYPLMRRTMESVAAERLSKIGQNPRLVSNREDLNEDLNLVKEIVSHVVPFDEQSNIKEEDEEDVPPEKERRKSLVMIGLQKFGFTKSKSVDNRAPPPVGQMSNANNAEQQKTATTPQFLTVDSVL